jgi:hypothetical protein
MASLIPTVKMTALIGELVRNCYTKIRWYGDFDTKCGNACLITLSLIPLPEAVTQINLLKRKFKKTSQLKQADKAIRNAAKLAGLTEADLLEISVPDYGLKEASKTVQFGIKKALVSVCSGKVELHWADENDKFLKSVPALVKTDFASELKELRAQIKEMKSVTSSERTRLEKLTASSREWDYAVWYKRYLTQPLICGLVRNMIWNFNYADGRSQAVFYREGNFVNVLGQTADVEEGLKITSWHPIDETAGQVLSWRTFLQEHLITQPFKQAHREIYVVTEAERTTATYSNRYHGHILKQSQFRALLEQRSWKPGGIIGPFDSGDTSCSYMMEEYNIRAELWVDSAYDDVGETGVNLYVYLDQVRFYSIDKNERLAVADVSPRAFSEAMRDVDLFVGVTSVGNDPDWRFRQEDYWSSYSFGELNESAETRKQTLEKIIPMLKIARQCSVEGRFLKIQGKLRTYKIHLGSGNILMEPNDEYLCIVKDSKSNSGIYLPFEGDRMLSVILSKALLLATDSKIKDPTIISQISM